MSGSEDLQKLISELEKIHARMEAQGEGLDESTKSATQMLEMYRRFHGAYKSRSFDVKMLKSVGEENTIELPYDWQALE